MIRAATLNDVPILVDWLTKLTAQTQTSTDDPYINNLQPDYDKAHDAFFIDANENGNGKISIFEEVGNTEAEESKRKTGYFPIAWPREKSFQMKPLHNLYRSSP